VLVLQLQTPLEHVFDVVDRVLEQHPGLVEKLELDVGDIQGRFSTGRSFRR
jgi:hypothetical protein